MSKSKRKTGRYHQGKVDREKRKTEFLKKFKEMMNSLAGESIYSCLSRKDIDIMYKYRCHPFRVVPAEGYCITGEILNDCQRFLVIWMQNQFFTIQPNDVRISLYDFYSVAGTIWASQIYLGKDDRAEVVKLKNSLKEFVDHMTEFNDKANEILTGFLRTYCFMKSDIRKTLYWVNYKLEMDKNKCRGPENILYLYSRSVENIKMKIDGIVRPVKPVCWALYNTPPSPMSIEKFFFTLRKEDTGKQINVYIQSHAVNRLSERIDCINTGLLQYYMYSSIKNPKIFYFCNNLLIEFQMFNSKAGYFRADLFDDKIIIRTFLFITNNGTPECYKLQKNTGLKKLDIKYLEIERLSTFMSSDVGNNEEVRRILEESDCGCLVELYEKVKDICTKQPEYSISDVLIDYIKYHNPEIGLKDENRKPEVSADAVPEELSEVSFAE